MFPDAVIGIDPDSPYALDVAQRRDPDALPPSNVVEVIGNLAYHAAHLFTRGNVQFALKGGIFAGTDLLFAVFVDVRAESEALRYSVCSCIHAEYGAARFQ